MRVEKIGPATLYLGDCLEVLPTLPIFDLMLTDPPYGIGADGKSFQNGTSANAELYGTEWDRMPPKKWLIDMAIDRAQASIIWGGNYFGLPSARCWLVWDKCTGENTYADAELAWTNLDTVVKVLKHPWVGANAKERGDERLHPTQKPVRVMSWCLSVAAKAQTICDPFMGSGTTGVACMQAGKQFWGIERHARYFDVACERIANAQRQEKLFA